MEIPSGEKFKEKHKERNKKYTDYVELVSPKQTTWKSLFNAYWIGGLICLLGQVLFDLARLIFKVSEDKASTIALIVLIFLTALLTGIGIFDKIAYYAGGGTFLPITGFANAISSAAIEFKAEGLIFGLSSKFYTVAGPVIVNGILSSFIVGLIYYIIGLF
ncbi:MAG TPA: stage V sporulation protein AC [Clostridia bacterium]